MPRTTSPTITRAGNAEITITSEIGGVALAIGAIPYAQGVSKFGYNASVGITYETIWEVGGLYPWPTTIETVDIVSTDAADTAAGVGARSLLISGLDENYDDQEELIILNGLTPVTSIKTWVRVFRAYVVVAGSSSSAVGDITVSQTTSGNILAFVDGLHNQTLQCIYTIPAGKSGILRSGKFSCGKGKEVQIAQMVRTPGGVFRVSHASVLYQNNYGYNFQSIDPIPEKSDIEIRAVADVAGVVVSASFEMVLIDNKE